MASKTVKVLVKETTLAQRLLWEKYNKPNRNLFQALTAFENNGVGRKVVGSPSDPFVVVGYQLMLRDAVQVRGKGTNGLLLHDHGDETPSINCMQNMF
jgi:hypothetical protein